MPVRHALVLPPDEELWAAALALRAGEVWAERTVHVHAVHMQTCV